MKLLLVLIGLALISAGPASLFIPDLAAQAFGIPADSEHACGYLLATGVRDVALGSWLLALVGLGASRKLLAASVFAIAIVAAGDVLNVCAHSDWQLVPAHVGHLGGLVVLLAFGGWMWWGARD